MPTALFAIALMMTATPALAALPAWLETGAIWGAGLICGIAFVFGLRVHWRALPGRLRTWFARERERIGWTLLGSVFTGVILFY